MYYRALKYTNGGEEVEFRHFQSLNAAYTSLIPINDIQENERWHIKMLQPVVRAFDTWANQHGSVIGLTEVIGWNELDLETTIYIQSVASWDSALPRF
jgi:hypothetical protein